VAARARGLPEGLLRLGVEMLQFLCQLCGWRGACVGGGGLVAAMARRGAALARSSWRGRGGWGRRVPGAATPTDAVVFAVSRSRREVRAPLT